VPRLFVAVRPPPTVVDQIAVLPRPDEPGVRWVPSDQWHVTLRFLGESTVSDAAAALEAPLPVGPVEAVLGPAVSRLGRSVMCLPVRGVDALAAALTARTAGIGEPPPARPFAGHLTLARLRHRAACGLAGTPFHASFPVNEVALVRSELTDRGAVHTVELVVPVGVD
jgi:2'-5' RNA ligase